MIVDDFMTLEQRRKLIKEGVVILQKLFSGFMRTAIEAIKRKKVEHPMVQALYHNSPLRSLLQEPIGGQICLSVQIAVRCLHRLVRLTSIWASYPITI